MTTVVRDNAAARRYELLLGDEVIGFTDYKNASNGRILLHTEILSTRSGQGNGSSLVRGILKDLRKQGIPAIARCPFVREWLSRHPEEFQDVLAAEPA